MGSLYLKVGFLIKIHDLKIKLSNPLLEINLVNILQAISITRTLRIFLIFILFKYKIVI